MTNSPIYQTINPATGKVLKEYPSISDSDVDAIVDKSLQAFNEWGKLTIAGGQSRAPGRLI